MNHIYWQFRVSRILAGGCWFFFGYALCHGDFVVGDFLLASMVTATALIEYNRFLTNPFEGL